MNKKNIKSYSKNGSNRTDMDWVKKLESATGTPFRMNTGGGIVYLVIDCSGSMGDGDKIEQARRGASGFSRDAKDKGYSVGIISFDSDTRQLLDPQDDLNKIDAALYKLYANNSTNMAAGIKLATEKLKNCTLEKVMCIITDGQVDDRQMAIDAAEEAKHKNIDIMTIGTDDADEEFLKLIATRSELSVKVARTQLESGIASMAKMLPDKSK